MKIIITIKRKRLPGTLYFKKITALLLVLVLSNVSLAQNNRIGLTLIPPSPVTNRVDLDIRAGIVNYESQPRDFEVYIYLNKENKKSLLHYSRPHLKANSGHKVQLILPTSDKVGMNKVILKVRSGEKMYSEVKEFQVIESDTRSTRQIDGAWVGIYHCSETEGKHWNKDIAKVTDAQWQELVRSMNSIAMNTIVLQEVFRNDDYVGKHSLTVESYAGKAFYPSNLYPGRMPVAANDPVEAILSEADKHHMSVMVGVGLFAWFDFTSESLEWHKRVAKELWDKYGHHPSFYGFYVSEESGGSLDNWELTTEAQMVRKRQIVEFFRAFKAYCNRLAPEKPIMLATNSMGIQQALDTYPALLQNLDILCPFGFARMPEGDLSGEEAATLLQQLCDDAGSHLWLDLEAFLFNPDQSLYPRPVEEIIHDLTLFDNFEKILCYQYPGFFSDPKASIRVGEEKAVKLFKDYKAYLDMLKENRTKKNR
ncbi:MAG: DUF4434 domain-containing protein [Bacteroidota bacterium]|nr:DUF4434 domain-containing protein [Bacteroidota bacterium]